MRGEPLSICERNFILNSFIENTRIDGRKCDESRAVKIIVGNELGSCLVLIGRTKVHVQVSCFLSQPSTARGNMGSVEVYVDMSPMASPTFEDGKLGSKGSELKRMLERLLKYCGVFDLESLCIRSFKQAWTIRVDVHVLDADGSIVDCASIATITGLMHFRLPCVTVHPDSIVIHKPEEKVSVPLNIYHAPICSSFGIYDQSRPPVIDPTDREESCLTGCLIVAANKRNELCALYQSGNLNINQKMIMECMKTTTQRAIDINELIMLVISDDNLKRSGRQEISGFKDLISLDVLNSHSCEPNEFIAPAVKINLIHGQDMDEISIRDDGFHIGSQIQSRDEEELIEQVKEIRVSHKTQSKRTEMDELNDLLDGIEQDFALSSSDKL